MFSRPSASGGMVGGGWGVRRLLSCARPSLERKANNRGNGRCSGRRVCILLGIWESVCMVDQPTSYITGRPVPAGQAADSLVPLALRNLETGDPAATDASGEGELLFWSGGLSNSHHRPFLRAAPSPLAGGRRPLTRGRANPCPGISAYKSLRSTRQPRPQARRRSSWPGPRAGGSHGYF